MFAGREATSTQQFYAALVPMLGMAPFAFVAWSWPQDAASWVAFALVGVFGWLGHQVLTIAHRYAPATTIAPFGYVQIIFMALSGWIVFADVPDAWVLLGAAMVVSSGLYVWLRERQQGRG
jgi:drug/metabolite transporter (DMT)-like permease